PCRESDEAGPSCKCESHLIVYVHDPEGHAVQLPDGATLREGDTIQVGYVATAGYAAIVSLDGWGVVTTHLPPRREPTPRRGVLDHAFRLDDAPDYERFFLVVDDTPFDLASIHTLVEDGRIGDDPRLVDTFEIRKGP
ncbi:MAG: hypothetical protein AAF602_25020, partial [Myxococcota bacterium]